MTRPTMPEVVSGALDDFVARIDRDLPGVLTGCYVVGSVALGDFVDRASNIDVVAVADEVWDRERRRTVTKGAPLLSHHGHAPTVRFVSWAELADPPAEILVGAGGGDPGDLDPFTRDVLSDAPARRGPSRPTIAHRPDAIEAWAADLLTDRWGPWASSAHHRPAKTWMKRSLANPVLEVGRLYAASKGDVLSKTQAAHALIADLPAGGGRKVLSEALSYREGATSSMYWGPVERKRDALALIRDLAGRVGTPTG